MNEPSLIPDAYVKEHKEIRRTIFGVLLFVVVMSGVVAAFLVTNKQWDSVHERQIEVALRFEEVATKITHMEELRGNRDVLVERAELASALAAIMYLAVWNRFSIKTVFANYFGMVHLRTETTRDD